MFSLSAQTPRKNSGADGLGTTKTKGLSQLEHVVQVKPLINDYTIGAAIKQYSKGLIDSFPLFEYKVDTASLGFIKYQDRVEDEIWDMPLEVLNYPIGKTTTTLRELNKTQYLVLDFWALWCKPCMKSMIHWEAINPSIKDKITVVGVHVDFDYKAQAEVNKRGWKLVQIIGKNAAVLNRYFSQFPILGPSVWISGNRYIGASHTAAPTDEYIYQLRDGKIQTIPAYALHNMEYTASQSAPVKQESYLDITVLNGQDQIAIEGLTVRDEKGAILGRTNENGSLKIKSVMVPKTLHFQHMGFDAVTETDLSQKSMLVVTMHPRTQILEEVDVVHTGYYSLPKERATGSFSNLTQADLERRHSPNILQRLDGAVTGLQFVKTNGNDAGDIRVRGVATMESSEAPLIVLDGFPFDGNINAIPPDDIENITVLKDAAASSIWGARAGNGVIVINTKKGKFNTPLQVDLSSNLTVGQKPDLFYNKKWLPAATLMEIEKTLYERGAYTESPQQTVFPAYVEWLIKAKNGEVSPELFEKQKKLFEQSDIRKEVGEHLMQGQQLQQYALAIRGGSEKAAFGFSTGYNRGLDNLIGNASKRLNFAGNYTFKLLKNLDISVNTAYVKQWTTANGLDINSLNPRAGSRVSTYVSLRDNEGNSLAIPFERRMRYYDSATSSGLLDWHYRPLDEIKLRNRQSKNEELRFQTGTNYSFLDLFSIQATYQVLQNRSVEDLLYNKDSYFVRNLVNQLTQADGTRILPYGDIFDQYQTFLRLSQSGRLQLNFNKSFQRHHLHGLLGSEIKDNTWHIRPGFRLYGYDSELMLGTAAFDYTKQYPALPTGSAMISAPSVATGKVTDRYLSYFGNIGYDFDGRYLLTASMRWDGSNLYGVKTNQKGVPLWSVGIGWDIAKESFFKFDDLLSQLKLRATYGIAGNTNKNVSVFPLITNQIDSRTNLIIAIPYSYGNPSLRWEKVKTNNFGLDLRSKDNRLNFTADYYVKTGLDLIGKDFMLPSSGINDATGVVNKINYADIRTKGTDIQLGYRILNGAMTWHADLLYSYTANKIQKFNTNKVTQVGNYFGAPPPTVGRSKDVMYALPWYGLDSQTGKLLVKANDELGHDYENYMRKYNPVDLMVMGSQIPTSFGSLRNTFHWNNFSMTFNLLYKMGYVFRRQSISPGREYVDNNYHMDYFKRWKQPGDEKHTIVPAASDTFNQYETQSYIYAEPLVLSGSHIRIQDAQLTYTIKKPFGGLCRQISAWVYGNNLGVLWKANREDIDPDFMNADYVTPKQFTIGFNLSF